MRSAKNSSVTCEKVRSLFCYDPDTGILTHRINRGHNAKAGEIAGCVGTQGYRFVKINKRKYGAARVIWLYMTGSWPEKEIDHINRVRDDNRWCNLREADRAENCANKYADGQYFRGVKKLSKKSWGAVIKVKQENIYLGSFPTEEFAALAYDAAAKKYFGAFAKFNFPEKAHRDWLVP